MDKEKLLNAPNMFERDVEVPDVGVVRVRCLARGEVLRLYQGAGENPDLLDIEPKVLALGMVDPKLTEAEVRQWYDTAPFFIVQPLVETIMTMSGMKRGSAKEAVKEFEANPDAEFPVLPGTEAGHDGGPAASGDA